jgi:hypothetical protein
VRERVGELRLHEDHVVVEVGDDEHRLGRLERRSDAVRVVTARGSDDREDS